MYINGSSGIIYQYNDPKSVPISSSMGNDPGVLLYGKDSNFTKTDSGNNGGLIFGGQTYDSKENTNNSIDQTSDLHLKEDVSERLNLYRKQLKVWKNRKEDIDIVNSFGLDMNSQLEEKDKETIDSVLVTEKEITSFEQVIKEEKHRTIGNDYSGKDRNRNDRPSFEPISFHKQRSRNESKHRRTSNETSNNNSEERRSRLLPGTKKQKASKGNEVRKKGRTRKAGKAVKSVTKASLKTSGSLTFKGFLAAWGLGSSLVKQDILFRLILGLFVGASFVTLVIMGS